MGRFDELKALIDENITTNGQQEITGAVLNSTLDSIVDATDEQLTELESETGAFKITEQGGYIDKSGNYNGAENYHSLTTERIPTKAGDVFLYKGIGRSSAMSYIYRKGETIVSRGTNESPNEFVEVITPDNVDSVQFSSFANIANPVILEVIKKGYIGDKVKKIDEISNDVKSIHEDIEETNKTLRSKVGIESKNLVNAEDEDYLKGYYLSPKGELFVNASYDTTGFIPVIVGASYNNALEDAETGLRFVLFYDQNKQVISNSLIEFASSFVAIENSAFVRISFYADSDYKQLTQSDERLMYQSYNPIGRYVDDTLLSKNIKIERTYNLLNPKDKDYIKGYYFNPSQNQPFENANYDVSGFIPVKGNTEYFAGLDSKGFRFVVYYADKNTKLRGGENECRSFVTPASAGYVKVTIYREDENFAQVTEGAAYAYEPYIMMSVPNTGSNANSIATRGFVEKYAGGILYGKKWCACGDSFTAGDFSGLADESEYKFQDEPYAGLNKVYPYIIGRRCGMNIVNEAIGGSTMTYVGGTRKEFSTPSGRYTKIPADADYITLYFGINDASYAKGKVGTIDDEDNTTFYGAWNIVMKYLIENHPNAKIGIIVTNGTSEGSTMIDFINAERAIAKKWGVGFLDMNSAECPYFLRQWDKPDISPEMARLRDAQHRVSEDNWHPNVKCHEYESTIIENFLKSL